MEVIEAPYRRIVLVCVNERDDGRPCCAHKGSIEWASELKARVKAADPTVRVVKTKCLGSCKTGAMVVVMPENTWYAQVNWEDLDALVAKIVE